MRRVVLCKLFPICFKMSRYGENGLVSDAGVIPSEMSRRFNVMFDAVFT
jgi:hypothetical protein